MLLHSPVQTGGSSSRSSPPIRHLPVACPVISAIGTSHVHRTWPGTSISKSAAFLYKISGVLCSAALVNVGSAARVAGLCILALLVVLSAAHILRQHPPCLMCPLLQASSALCVIVSSGTIAAFPGTSVFAQSGALLLSGLTFSLCVTVDANSVGSKTCRGTSIFVTEPSTTFPLGGRVTC